MTSPAIGLDLSLSATGIAGVGWAETITYPARQSHPTRWLRGKGDAAAVGEYQHQRMAFWSTALVDYLRGVPRMVVLEGLALHKQTNSTSQIVWQNWAVRHQLWLMNIPYAVVNPSQLKLYATGDGGRTADKDAMAGALAEWWPDFDGDDNACDAAWCMALGMHLLDDPVAPVNTVRAEIASAIRPDTLALTPGGDAR